MNDLTLKFLRVLTELRLHGFVIDLLNLELLRVYVFHTKFNPLLFLIFFVFFHESIDLLLEHFIFLFGVYLFHEFSCLVIIFVQCGDLSQSLLKVVLLPLGGDTFDLWIDRHKRIIFEYRTIHVFLVDGLLDLLALFLVAFKVRLALQISLEQL